MATGCRATNQAGAPCSAQPLPSGWCRWHDPSLAGERAAWSRKGGAARSNKQRALKKLPDDLLSLRAVQALLCGVLRDVTAGRIEVGVANASASVARAIAAVAQAGDLEERLAELEKVAGTETRGWTA